MSASADPIRSWLDTRIAVGITPGATWWVREGSRVLSRGAAGSAVSVPAPIPTTEDTPYDLASLTKVLATALIAVLLEQDGILDLEAPALRWVDELHGSPYESVSCVELGAHRAGLPAWSPLFLASSSLEGYLRQIACAPQAKPRGEEHYSDLGYVVLGAVVERATGVGLDRLYAERVAAPMGIESCFACTPGGLPDAAATEAGNRYERALAGERASDFPWRTGPIRGEVHDVNAYGLGGVAGHAGLFGTAREVAAIGSEFLRSDRLGIGRDARGRLLKPVGGRGGRTFGLVRAESSDAARDVLPQDAPGHTGFTGTSLWLDPHEDRVYVLLSNRIHPLVADVDFQAERREFHRLAAGLA